MIWVAWRQHRTTILSMLLAITAAAAIMVYQRFALDSALESAGASGCLDGDASEACVAAIGQVSDVFGTYGLFWPMVLQVLTLVGGAVVGATVFGSELGAGTHMFSLTQSISRKRWWKTKFTVVVVPLLLAMLALGAVSHWAFLPFQDFGDQPFRAFDSFGLMPAAFFLFAVSVGSTLGLATKSVVTSMVVAALAVTIIALTIGMNARPYYMEPVMDRTDAAAEDFEPSDGLIVDQYYVEKNTDPATADCDFDCAEEEHDFVTLEQPSERVWTFQGIEAGIYLLLSVGFIGATGVIVRRRLP